MTSLELRPRLASEIVDAAFQLYRRYFTELVTLSALCLSPYIVLQLVVTGGRTDAPELTSGGVLWALIAGGWLFGSFLEAAVVLAVSNSYLRGQPDVAGALRQTLSRLVKVLLAILAKWLIIGSGIMFAVVLAVIVTAVAVSSGGANSLSSGSIGGVILVILLFAVALLLSIPMALYFFASYFAVPATVMLEGLGVRAGLRRSSLLSKGNKKRIYAALGVPLVIWVLLQLTLNATLQLLPGPPLVAFLIEQSAYVLGQPIISVIATLVYYDARIRKEGFDIEVMAGELGVAGSDVTGPPAQPM